MANSSDSLLAVGLISFVAFTLLGNSVVLIVLICRARRLMKKPLYLFIFNICLSDIFATLFTMTFEVSEEITHEWKFSEDACKAIEYLEMTFFGVNIFTHLSIAIERYRNVVQPLKPPMKKRTANVLVLISWAVPLVMSLPYIYTLRLLKQSNGHYLCGTVAMPWTWLDKLFLSVELLIIFLIPLVCIVWMYSVIVQKLYQRNHRSASVSPSTRRSTMRAAAIYGSRVSIAVVSVFVLCWLPFIIVYIVRLLTDASSVNRSSTLYIVALYSSFGSELLTPLLYCAFDRNIKPVLMDTVRCRSRTPVISSDYSDVTTPDGRTLPRTGAHVLTCTPSSNSKQ